MNVFLTWRDTGDGNITLFTKLIKERGIKVNKSSVQEYFGLIKIIKMPDIFICVLIWCQSKKNFYDEMNLPYNMEYMTNVMHI